MTDAERLTTKEVLALGNARRREEAAILINALCALAHPECADGALKYGTCLVLPDLERVFNDWFASRDLP